jgi:hypothetical protein
MPGGYFKRVVGRRRLGRVEKKNQVKKERKKVRLTKVGGREKRRKTLLACLKDKRDDGRLYFSLKKRKRKFLFTCLARRRREKKNPSSSLGLLFFFCVQHTHTRTAAANTPEL